MCGISMVKQKSRKAGARIQKGRGLSKKSVKKALHRVKAAKSRNVDKIHAKISKKAIKHTVESVKARAAKAHTQMSQRALDAQNKQQAQKKAKKDKVYIPSQREVKLFLNLINNNLFAMDYLKKNVSKNAMDVIGLLGTPKTDEYIAAQLDIKINSVRRILNIMQGYGITNYYVAKNTNGWLSFAWYVNTNKLQSFFDYINSIKGEEVVIKDDCNDYFVCGTCYKNDKLLFTFDAAYEAGFKCGSCGSKFNRISREEAQVMVEKSKNVVEQIMP